MKCDKYHFRECLLYFRECLLYSILYLDFNNDTIQSKLVTIKMA